MKDWLKHEKTDFFKGKKVKVEKIKPTKFSPESAIKLAASVVVLGAGVKILGDL